MRGSLSGWINHMVLRWLPAILLLLLPQFTLAAKKWDREAATTAFSKARQLQTALQQQENPSTADYLRCIRAYQRVYLSDPHYGASDDAIFEAGCLYREAARRFENESYSNKANRLLRFLISDYPRSRHCKAASGLLQEPPRRKKTENKGQPTPERAMAASEDPGANGNVSLRSVRHWSNEGHTRVTIDLDNPARFTSGTLADPSRIFIDIQNSQAIPTLRETIRVGDGKVQQIRIGQNLPDLVRVVLDLEGEHEYSFRELQDPYRIVIDVQSARPVPGPDQLHPEASTVSAKSNTTTGDSPPRKVDSDEPVAAIEVRSGDAEKPGNPSAAAASVQPEVIRARRTVAPTDRSEPEVQPRPAALTSRGDRTLTRVLGLKIQRIVIDPGHGGHDTGTIGPSGLLEKELVLRVAKQLKELLVSRLGAEVVLTRTTDAYLSLEERTSLANSHQADLFLSLHANSSRHRSISGVETYYLDFASTDEAKELAARENSMTRRNIRELQDMVKSIATADKSAESREFATIIQRNLFRKSKQINPKTRNRGVRSAPFVVLIGARMPSVLAELGFVSNPSDEKLLKTGSNQGQLAEALFSGIESYMETLGSYVAQSHQTNP